MTTTPGGFFSQIDPMYQLAQQTVGRYCFYRRERFTYEPANSIESSDPTD